MRIPGRPLAAVLIAGAALSLAGCYAPTDAASTVGPVITSTPTPSATASSTPTPAAVPTNTPIVVPDTQPVTLNLLEQRFDAETSAIVVSASVVDYVSDSGTCTLTATNGSVTLTASAAGVADAAVTYCAGLAVAVPATTASWQVTVAFADATSGGAVAGEVIVP